MRRGQDVSCLVEPAALLPHLAIPDTNEAMSFGLCICASEVLRAIVRYVLRAASRVVLSSSHPPRLHV
jgi:hypothetical protein